MTAISPSRYDEITIESSDGKFTTIDLRLGVASFYYYEDLLSPTVTAQLVIVSAEGVVSNSDKTDKKESLYNGLPIRGGERVLIKIAGNSKVNKDGLDFSDRPSRYFYVGSVTNVLIDEGTESFTLNLVSRETITNETVKVGKKFPTSQKISDTVENILKKYIKTDKEIIVDETQNPYGFIGNMKKPFTILTWLASKSVSGESKSSKDSSAGYVFYLSLIHI